MLADRIVGVEPNTIKGPSMGMGCLQLHSFCAELIIPTVGMNSINLLPELMYAIYSKNKKFVKFLVPVTSLVFLLLIGFMSVDY